MDRYQKAIGKIERSGKEIGADPTIPGDLKKAFLGINRFLIAEVKKYKEAQETLGRPYHRPGDLLRRACAKDQIKDTKVLAGVLGELMDEHGRKIVPGIEAGSRESIEAARATGET